MLADKIYTNVRLGDLRRPLEYVVELTGIAIIYVGLAKLSLALASIHPSATPIWPPTGYALGAVLLLGYRVSPAIFLGALVANVTTAGSISTALAIAAGNTLESLIGAYFIDRWSDGRGTFDTPAGVSRFALICLIPSTMTSAIEIGKNVSGVERMTVANDQARISQTEKKDRGLLGLIREGWQRLRDLFGS
jgi:integral membrane sensor domain MASE1